MTGSARRVPSAWGTSFCMASVIALAALPMSIWPQAMSWARPSSASVLGGGVGDGAGARRVRRDGAVVDDAPAARLLAFHQRKRALAAEKAAVEIDLDRG